jgi:hypothetical protein
MIIFHFIFKMLKNLILKVELSRIKKNIFIYTRCQILQNGLYVDEMLIKFLKKVNGALKDTYILSNYVFYNHNISNL